MIIIFIKLYSANINLEKKNFPTAHSINPTYKSY